MADRLLLFLLIVIAGQQIACSTRSESILSPKAERAFVADGDPRFELDPDGRLIGLSVSEEGKIRIWTDNRTFAADSIYGDWNEVTEADSYVDTPGSADSVLYFNADTAIAVGARMSSVTTSVGTDSSGSPEQQLVYVTWILRTTTGGRTWDSVPVPSASPVTTAAVEATGNAVIGTHAGTLFHSRDFGQTWRSCTLPFTGNRFDPIAGSYGPQSIGSVEMISEDVWLVSADGRNLLQLSTDAGKTWSDVETPLDQNGHSRQRRVIDHYAIDRMAVLGDHIVVRQEDRLWVAHSSNLRWKSLAVSLTTMVSLAGRDTIVGVTEQGDVIAIDRELRTTFLYPQSLSTLPSQMVVRAGTIYILDIHGALYQIAGGRVTYGYPLSSTATRPTLYDICKRGNVWWGSSGHHLYRSHTDTAGWYRVGSLPMTVDDIVPRNENEVIVIGDLGRTYEFRFDERAFYTVPGLDTFGISTIQHRGSNWIAFGNESGFQREEPDTWRRTSRLVPEEREGFVCASNDSGRTWWRADTWSGETIDEVYFSTDGYLFMISSSARARTIKLLPGSANVVVDATQTGAPAGSVSDRWLFFRGSRGWLVTVENMCIGGPDYRYTADGGQTWSSAAAMPFIWNATPFRDGFLALRAGDVVYITDDSLTSLVAAPPGAALRRPTDVTPIDEHRILVEMDLDTGFNPQNRVWSEHRVP